MMNCYLCNNYSTEDEDDFERHLMDHHKVKKAFRGFLCGLTEEDYEAIKSGASVQRANKKATTKAAATKMDTASSSSSTKQFNDHFLDHKKKPVAKAAYVVFIIFLKHFNIK